MDALVNPQKTIEIIQKNEFSFRKRFGQNFLIDAHVLEKIMQAADVSPGDLVLEVGPGIGTMTQAIAQRGAKVVAVEIDDSLIPILKENLKEYPNVEIVHGDILKLDLWELSQSRYEGKPFKVVANLPYYITTPIIMGLLESGIPMESITVMVQKEVAERMQAGPGTKDYGALSLAVQYYAEPYLAANVPSHCFIPRPTVGSAVIRLTRRKEPPVQVDCEDLLFALIRASFLQRRKTLANGLANSSEISFSKEEIYCALRRLNISESIRGEALTLGQFADLANVLGEGRKGNGVQ